MGSGHKVGGQIGNTSRRAVDWARGEELFVRGEIVDGVVSLPNLAEIARRLNVTKQAVHVFARRHAWHEQRERVRSGAPVSIAVSVTADADVPPDVAQIVDRTIRHLREQIDAGRVRSETVSALDRAIRLRQYLMEVAAESHVERATHLPSLGDLQKLHSEHRTREAEVAANPAVAGLLHEPAVDDLELR